jgi:hypothetical protein
VGLIVVVLDALLAAALSGVRRPYVVMDLRSDR